MADCYVSQDELLASQAAQDAAIAALQAAQAGAQGQLVDTTNTPLPAGACVTTCADLAALANGFASQQATQDAAIAQLQTDVAAGAASSVPAGGITAGTLGTGVTIDDTANFGTGAVATDTNAGVVALNMGATGDDTNCADALTACGLTALLNQTGAGSPNALQLALQQALIAIGEPPHITFTGICATPSIGATTDVNTGTRNTLASAVTTITNPSPYRALLVTFNVGARVNSVIDSSGNWAVFEAYIDNFIAYGASDVKYNDMNTHSVSISHYDATGAGSSIVIPAGGSANVTLFLTILGTAGNTTTLSDAVATADFVARTI
jgi:hypothetical protein